MSSADDFAADDAAQESGVQPKGPDNSAVWRLAVAGAIAAWALATAAHAQVSVRVTPHARTPAAADSLAIEDPFEPLNRRFYAIHQAIDHAILRPLALGYSHATTTPVRKALHNLITEVGEPIVFANDVAQLRVKRAVKTFARFMVNATVGVGGLFDPARKIGLPHRDNGFGNTLGRYGIRPGPYIFLPLVGPSTLRDLIGTGVDFYSDPVGRIHYHDRGDVLVGLAVVGGLDERANAESDLQQIEAMGTDSYATLRSLYLQQRQADVHGEAPVRIEDLPSFDDLAPPPAAAAPAAAGPAEAGLPDAPAPLPELAAPPAPAPAAEAPAPASPAPAASDAGATKSAFVLPAPAAHDDGVDAAYFLAPPIEL